MPSAHIIARTSASHPLVIAELTPGSGTGRIGLSLCPGKRQDSALTGRWERDLDADLDAIRDWGAVAVVTLLESAELEALHVERLGSEVRRRHMAWYHLPIADFDVPNDRFEAAWHRDGAELRRRLRNGFDIFVHCKGGLGRAGTIAARLLVELGRPAKEAIDEVRLVRPGAIETRAQEHHIHAQPQVLIAEPSRNRGAIRDRAVGAFIGLAVGDAIGTTLEFSPRDTRPILSDMVGGGRFSLKPGEWTDDTAMALALADSLLALKGLDEFDLMSRFTDWRDNGSYSCTGTCFDIGNTTSAAIDRWLRMGEPIAGSADPQTAGNGSLMRLAPVAMLYWNRIEMLVEIAERQSRATHAAPEAVAACSSFAVMLADAIAGHPLEAVLNKAAGRAHSIEERRISAIAAGCWRGCIRDRIRSSGYVVESMEAAVWSVARSASFEEAVLSAANLGGDADTIAAIAGQLAGATYGLAGIPAAWVSRLAWKDRILHAGHDLVSQSLAKDKSLREPLGQEGASQ